MKRSYRNIAFLAELMINILVFSISCAILAGLFGKAGLLAKNTKEESFALNELHALVQEAGLRGLDAFPQGETQPDGNLHLYYDKSWLPAPKEAAAYTIILTLNSTKTEAGELYAISASAQNAAGKEITRLETSAYHPGEGGMPT